MMKYFTLNFLLIFMVGQLGAQSVFTIAEARRVDSEGVMVNLNAEVILEGVAIGPNFRPGGQTFILVDIVDGIGINIFSDDDPLDYEVTDGDRLRITGTLGQFNGLEQILPSSIEILSQGEAIPEPRAVTVLDENTQSFVVKIEDVSLVDPTQWSDSGSFNVDVTNGTNTYALRIDGDTDISGMEAPTGTFTITGIGGQFDADTPLRDGYQLLPRSLADISPYNTGTGGGPTYTPVTMPQLRMNDANGIPMMDGQQVEITATAYGLNRRDVGVQFTIINDNNVGVAIFNADEDLGYSVTEGDMITVRGTVGHFNGLTQVSPEEIDLLSTDNQLVNARLVDVLDETTESSLVYIEPVDVEDGSQWLGDGSNFNVNFLNDNNGIMTVRIEDQTDLSTLSYPGSIGTWYFGIGGQFDSSDPRAEGYQLLPRYSEDIVMYLSTDDFYAGEVDIYPNPAYDQVNVVAAESPLNISLWDMNGRQLLIAREATTMKISGIAPQIYLLKVQFESGVHIQKLIVE